MRFVKDRKVVVPIAAYAFLALCAVFLFDTVVRVYALTLVCLAIAFLVPALVSARLRSLLSRLGVSSAAALLGVLLFDGTARMVLVKFEPFRNFENGWWHAYLLGLCLFVPLSFGTAWIAAPLRKDSLLSLRRWLFADAR